MAYHKSSDGPFGLLPKKTAPDVLSPPPTVGSSGTPITLEFIDTRAGRGSRETFEAVFNKVPSTEPELEDWFED